MSKTELIKLKREAVRILSPLGVFEKSCHAASIRLVRHLGYGRVARGYCKGVRGQHSWVVIGDNCYHPKAVIVDGTLWSYDSEVRGVWIGTMGDGRHRPHGAGNIWNVGRPPYPKGSIVKLEGVASLSDSAKVFLELLGSLDMEGWHHLANGPMEGWPAGEILAAMDDTKALSALVPIDRLGMLTDRNPGGLYLPEKHKEHV
jgi:hypothetical protein